MRKLGIDFGTKRIGLAVSDGLGLLAHPLEVVPNDNKALVRILTLITEHEIDTLILGSPKTLCGEEGGAAWKKVCHFERKLKEHTTLPIITIDERFSTADAQRVLRERGWSAKKQKSVIDAVAAVMILQRYLDVEKNI